LETYLPEDVNLNAVVQLSSFIYVNKALHFYVKVNGSTSKLL